MTQIYTPTATSHGSYTLPSDGDPAVAESVNDAFRDLADNALLALNNAASALALAGQAINGVTGGTYTPSGDITINGPGRLILGTELTVSGLASFLGNTQFSLGGVTISASSVLAVAANASFSGVVSLAGSTTASGNFTSTGTFSATGSVIGLGNSSSDDLTVLASALFSSPATFDGTAEFNGITQFNNNVLLNDDVQLGTSSADAIQALGQLFLHSRLRYSDTGRVPYREPVSLPDTDATVSLADGEVFVVPYNMSSSRIYTLSTSGASRGDKLIFISGVINGLAHNLTLSAFQSIGFSTGDRCVYAEFVYLDAATSPAGTAGWFVMTAVPA